ncbi:hypothetical protein NliqN6_5405 [Naganishia liquefaciens]|uniref:Uncharacterized protein n=1 Tax=Naganishia liquefaciens TaxID=104408 RepID=A0A8H3YH56_9TREE|nr:hypothetical protein NliqN6_5405 [Naganishia liquefaciens]
MAGRADEWDEKIDKLDASLESIRTYVTERKTSSAIPGTEDLSKAQMSIFDCESVLEEYIKFLDQLSNFVTENSQTIDSYFQARDSPSSDPKEIDEWTPYTHHDVIQVINEDGLDGRKTFLEQVQEVIDTLTSQWNLSGETVLIVPQSLREDVSGEETTGKGHKESKES